MALPELDSEKGKVTRTASIAVDKAPLSLRARSGIDPRLKQAGGSLRYWSRIGLSDSQRSGVARDLIENEKLVRLSRSLHAAWRDAVRTPWRNLRRRLRDALPVSSEGVPVALDEATDLTVVPYEGGLPPPLSQCEVVAACAIPNPPASAQRQFDERRTRPLHRSHRSCAGDDARASRQSILVSGLRPLDFAGGSSLAPFVPWPLSGGVLVVDQGDRRAAASGRNARAPAPSRATRARASYRRRAFADRRVGQAQLRPLFARYRAADRSRRENGRANADLEAATLAAGADRPARGPARASSARSGQGRSFSNMRSPRTGSRA